MDSYWFFGGIAVFLFMLFLIFFYYRTKWRREMYQSLMVNSKLRQSHENGYRYKYRVK